MSSDQTYKQVGAVQLYEYETGKIIVNSNEKYIDNGIDTINEGLSRDIQKLISCRALLDNTQDPHKVDAATSDHIKLALDLATKLASDRDALVFCNNGRSR